MNAGPDVPAPSRAREVFLAALDQPDAAARARCVAAACADDTGLRQQVERLLADHFADDTFMDTPAGGELPGPAAGEAPGAVIGRYRLLERIGEGGMGVVYMAEQREPVTRRVALKVIKLGLDTRGVIARFEAERQALALMDHPHIAKVLDAGATESGRPYFVMELVQGLPITEFCARHKLTVAERLRLFLPVCHAVQHAHQKGVIHRDLKPSNILVTQSHGAPHPLVIDFGVAKATHRRLTEKTLFTHFGALIGTPAYMSPEQADPGREDVDTRSDLYSLGVLLYELLTGGPPFPEQRLRSAGLGEMQRIIQEEEPERPSTRLRKATAAQASSRITHHSSLVTDLDWIVMKCLEKDRRRRYETVNGLAADLQRHLASEPVTAHPPSTAYRLQKLVRRHRFAVTAGAAVLGALLLGTVISTTQAVRATKAEREQSALLKTARQAEQARTDELWHSLLITARASRQSRVAGRRFASLEAIRQAAAIRPSPELRNEAIAALALTDLGPPQYGQDAPWSGEWPVEADAAFDRDVRRVALNAQDGSIYVHRVEDHALLVHIPASTDFRQGEAVQMVFSPDDRCLAARAENGVIRCWELEPFRLIVETRLDAGLWKSLTFSPDSRYLVAGKADGEVFGFATDPASAPPDGPVREPARQMKLGIRSGGIGFDPSGTRLAVLWDRQAEIWRWPEGQKLQTLSFDLWCESLAWHPDSQHLWTVGEKGKASLWEISGPWSRRLQGPSEYLPMVSMHPRGDFVATYSYFGVTRLWNMNDEGPMLASPDGLARTFSRDGRRLGFFHMSKGYGYWPVEPSRTFRSLAGLSGGRSFGSLDFSPDGSILIWTDQSGFWSLDLRRGGYRRYPAEGMKRAHFNPSGDSLIVADGKGLGIQPIELDRTGGDVAIRWRGTATPVPGGEFEIHGNISAPLNRRQLVATEQLGRRFVLTSGAGAGKTLTSPYAPAIHNASVSPDQHWVALGHWKGGTCVLDMHTGQMAHSWPELNTAFVSFTPDGEWLGIGTAEGYRFYRTGTWEPGRRIARGVQSLLTSPLAFSPDGQTLATLRGLGTIELHDLDSGEALAALEAPPPQALFFLGFSPQGDLLVAMGTSTVQIWDLAEIRRELKSLNLDWHHPPIPDSGISIGELPFRYLVEPE